MSPHVLDRLLARFPSCFVLMALLFAVGCKSAPSVADTPPTYAELTDAHNERVAKLRALYCTGQIELRWRDEKNRRHFELGEIEFWHQAPRSTALRVEKLGEVLLWLGSDDSQYWLFDLTGEEKKLHRGKHDVAIVDDAESALAVRPLALLDLLALSPLPTKPGVPMTEGSPANPGMSTPDRAGIPVAYVQSIKAWMVEVPPSGDRRDRTRYFFDVKTQLPCRVEVLDSAGQVRFFSELKLDRYGSVEIKGVSPLGWPRMSEITDIYEADTTGRKPDGSSEEFSLVSAKQDGATVKIAMDSMSDGHDQPWDRLFDLQRLLKAFGFEPTVSSLDPSAVQ